MKPCVKCRQPTDNIFNGYFVCKSCIASATAKVDWNMVLREHARTREDED